MLPFFPRGVLGGILNLIESVSEGFPPTLMKNMVIDDRLLCFGSLFISLSATQFLL